LEKSVALSPKKSEVEIVHFHRAPGHRATSCEAIPQFPQADVELEAAQPEESDTIVPEKPKIETLELLKRLQVEPEGPEEDLTIGACSCSEERNLILLFLKEVGLPASKIEGIYDQDHNLCEWCARFIDEQVKKEQHKAEARKMPAVDFREERTRFGAQYGPNGCKHPACIHSPGTQHRLKGHCCGGCKESWRRVKSMSSEAASFPPHHTAECTQYQKLMQQMASQQMTVGRADPIHQMAMKQVAMQQMTVGWQDYVKQLSMKHTAMQQMAMGCPHTMQQMWLQRMWQGMWMQQIMAQQHMLANGGINRSTQHYGTESPASDSSWAQNSMQGAYSLHKRTAAWRGQYGSGSNFV
jgi:hypothetical protein